MAPKKHVWPLVLTLLSAPLAGCGEEKKTESKEKADDDEGDKKKKKKKEKKAEKPTFTGVYGDDKTVLHAYVVSEGTSSMVLQLSSEELKCDDVKPNGFSIGDKKLVSLVLANKLQTTGKREWVVARATGYNFDDKPLRNDRKEPGTFKVTSADPAKGLKANIELTLTGKEAKQSLVLKGDIDAKGCGVKKSSAKQPDPSPQKDLTLTIAGEKIEVMGAKITYEEDRQTIDLTTAPQDCRFRSAGDFGLSLAVKKDGGKHAFLRGDAIQGNLNTSGDLGVEVKLGPKKDGKQEVELKGGFTIFDYKVEYGGKAMALVCEKKKK